MAKKLTRMTKLVAIKGRLRKKVTSLASGQTKIGLCFTRDGRIILAIRLKSVTQITIYVTGG